MRLFLAVDLDDGLRECAVRAAGSLRNALADRAPRSLKWVEPANLHVTLHFLGEVADERAPDLVRRLSSPLSALGFEIGLGGVGVFPPHGPPRVVWIGIRPGEPAMAMVHRELAERLASAGVPVESRPLQAHVTLARIKQVVHGDLRSAAARVPVDTERRGRVDHVTVYRSHLGSGGPRYEAQARVPLRCP